MNKLEVDFALKLVDKIERNVAGYNKIRSYCEGLRDILEEQKKYNKAKTRGLMTRWKKKTKKQKEELLKKLHAGRDKWHKEGKRW